jgi:4-hydroxybenzoate polyprenyltransferase
LKKAMDETGMRSDATVLERAVTYGRMIKFSHSIFALPFALSGAALASMRAGITVEKALWIVVAMVGARSAAMGFNRLVDREMDAANPRTAVRELPRGAISPAAVRAFVVISSAVLIFAAYRLNPLCFALSPVALGIVFLYSYTKRFTWATQFFLGLSLAVAPIGAWIAITGRLDLEILLLGGAVLTWVAGFDVIYACQDIDFDRRCGLYSIPQRFGIRSALLVARLLHAVSFGLMVAVGAVFGLGILYLVGVVVVGLLMVYENRLVRPDDLSQLPVAFMNMNAIISAVYFLFTLGDVLLI